jgi:hypothetical protein
VDAVVQATVGYSSIQYILCSLLAVYAEIVGDQKVHIRAVVQFNIRSYGFPIYVRLGASTFERVSGWMTIAELFLIDFVAQGLWVSASAKQRIPYATFENQGAAHTSFVHLSAPSSSFNGTTQVYVCK